MTMKPLLFALSLAAAALGAPAARATDAPKLYHGVGVVDDIEKDGKVLVIEHEAIPGLMDAMTMPFELSDVKLGKGIKIGDRIRFTLVQQGHFWPIIALEKIKPRKAHKKNAAASPPSARPTATMAPMNMPM